MLSRIVKSLILALGVGLVIKSIPDVARYLKIRSM
jgi:hypothetical protein